MISTRVMVITLVLGVLVTGAVGTRIDPGGSRDGQLVFVPVGEIRPGSTGTERVRIESCRATPDGLVVIGQVDSRMDAQVRVAVQDAPSQSSGRAVGSGYADAAAILADASVGSFRVTLPQGTSKALFSVAGPLDERGDAESLGPIASCPG